MTQRQSAGLMPSSQLLEEHPELREPNPERQQALEAWLETLEEEEDDGGEAR